MFHSLFWFVDLFDEALKEMRVTAPSADTKVPASVANQTIYNFTGFFSFSL
jgi:hypothetical protein